jgi:hypothetical protein
MNSYGDDMRSFLVETRILMAKPKGIMDNNRVLFSTVNKGFTQLNHL